MKVHDRSLNQSPCLYVCSCAAIQYVLLCGEDRPHMDCKNWINCHIHAFEYFGGVSRILVPDNLKTGVIETQKYEDPVQTSSTPGNGRLL